MIDFYKPDIRLSDAAEIVKALDSGWTTRGDVCRRLEDAIRDKYEANGVFVTSSNTACLELTLRYLGVGEGDEVVTTPYTYSATADVIHNVGATIVFCDLQSGTYEMDYERLADLISEKTKAVIAVDMGGVPCDYEKIFEVVNSKKYLFAPSTEEQAKIGRVCVISDSAHSINCAGCGKVADFTALSFHAVKNITCGEGGALMWNVEDDRAYEKFCLLAHHGQTEKHDFYKYDIKLFGQNYVMTDYAAAFLLSQFGRVDEVTDKRVEQTMLYIDLIEECSVNYKEGSACHLMMVRLPEDCDRDMVVHRLYTDGICANVHYIPLPMFTAYKNIGFDISEFPRAHKEFKREITLPLYNDLEKADIEFICARFNKAVEENRYERSFF